MPLLLLETSLKIYVDTNVAFPFTVTGTFPKTDQRTRVKTDKKEIPTKTFNLGWKILVAVFNLSGFIPVLLRFGFGFWEIIIRKF